MTNAETFSAFMAPSQGSPSQSPGSLPGGGARKMSLPRRGKRPLTFTGSELCMAMNFVAGCYSWYEVNIYRTTEQKFVLCLRQFFRDETEQDTLRSWEFDSFPELVDALEAYDAAEDIRVTVFADEPGLSVPEMSAHALTLRAKAEAARSRFGRLVGEILFELEADA